MKKKAVETDRDELKKASLRECPKCGCEDLEDDGIVIQCPNCGTEPFESE